jgi:hypothetical protein
MTTSPPKEIMFDAGLWKRVRRAAFDQEISASELVRRATRRYLAAGGLGDTAEPVVEDNVVPLKPAPVSVAAAPLKKAAN